MPDLVKIGVTTRTVEERLDEANSNSTWMPFPYQAEFAKWVLSAEQREHTTAFSIPIVSIRSESGSGFLWRRFAFILS